MQQRFTENEMKRFHHNVCSAADLLSHPWQKSHRDQMANFDTKDPKDRNNMIKKKKSQFALHADDHI